MNEDDHGLLFTDTKTFYWMDYGNAISGKVGVVERMLNRLLVQGVIKESELFANPLPYQVLTYKQAKRILPDLTTKPIYLNDHIRKIREAQPTEPEQPSIWKKA